MMDRASGVAQRVGLSDGVGLAADDQRLARLQAYADLMGPGFTLSPLLLRKAAAGECFTR